MRSEGCSKKTQFNKLRKFGAELWKQKNLWVLLLPTLVLHYLFHYRPMYGIVLAFKEYNLQLGIMGSEWKGLLYFNRLISSSQFLRVLRNTIVISLLKVAVTFPMPIIYTLIINEIPYIRFKKINQTISYLPHFLSWVIVGALLNELLSTDGAVNDLVEIFGGTRSNLLTNDKLFVPLLLVSSLWKELGWGSIVYLAAINNIDPTLYEAGSMDGCSRIKMMYHITLPELLPTISVMFLLRIGNILNAGFDQIYNMYNSMVMNVGDIIDTYSYRLGLNNLDYSMSTAIGLFKNVIGVMLMLIVNNTVNKKDSSYGLM